MSRYLFAFVGLLFLGGPLGTVWPSATARAEDEPAADAQPEGTETDPYAVPENATVEELLEFMQRLQNAEPPGATRAEKIRNFAKVLKAMIGASEKIMAADAKPEQRATAIRTKLAALKLLKRIFPDDKSIGLTEFAESLVKDADPEIAAEAEMVLLADKVMAIAEADEATVKATIADVVEFIQKAKPMDRQHLGLAQKTAEFLEDAERLELAGLAYNTFAKLFAAAEDPELRSQAKKLEGAGRKATLIGKPIELSGAKFEGGEFDWKAYKGKVVLVDFWATWCGPCRAELPNVLEQYKKYHDKGFDVVGISLDEERAELEAFLKENEIPWVTLFSEDPLATGWDHPLATYYGIMGIPATMLVDQKGNVVSLSARGPELPELLEKLLGPVEEPAESGSGK